MSYASTDRLRTFNLDWLTVALVGLLVSFQAIVLAAVSNALTARSQPTQETELTVGVEMLAIAAVEIGIMLLVFRAYRRLSEQWQTRIKTVLKGAVAGALAAFCLWSYSVGLLTALDLVFALLVWSVYVAVKRWSNAGDFTWIGFNLAAFGLGVFATVSLALLLSPVVVVFLMVVLTVYDYVAVDLTDIMGDLVELSGRVGIPNFLVVPRTVRFDLDQLKKFLADKAEKPENMGFLIGLGDFIFPTALLASVAVSQESITSPIVLGGVIGTLVGAVILRDSMERRESGLPALLWLNTGALSGAIVAFALTVAFGV